MAVRWRRRAEDVAPYHAVTRPIAHDTARRTIDVRRTIPARHVTDVRHVIVGRGGRPRPPVPRRVHRRPIPVVTTSYMAVRWRRRAEDVAPYHAVVRPIAHDTARRTIDVRRTRPVAHGTARRTIDGRGGRPRPPVSVRVHRRPIPVVTTPCMAVRWRRRAEDVAPYHAVVHRLTAVGRGGRPRPPVPRPPAPLSKLDIRAHPNRSVVQSTRLGFTRPRACPRAPSCAPSCRRRVQHPAPRSTNRRRRARSPPRPLG